MSNQSQSTTSNASVIDGIAGGKHIINGPVTTDIATQASPTLLRNALDERIVKIRPMSTPLDQISRWGGCRKSASMIVDYYAVDTKPDAALVTGDVSGPNSEFPVDGYYRADLITDNNKIFEPTETILIPSVLVHPDKNGPQQLVLYISGKDTNSLQVIALNSEPDANGARTIPRIPDKARVIRMGRAASELDVQTSQFSAMPVKQSNYCQIFKAQVEQSSLMKIADKEVGWSLSDQEEVAIIDMRLGMEKNFLFGGKCRHTDANKGETVFTTGGIWNQATKTHAYASSGFNTAEMIKLARQAFTKNAGSKRKILLAGSDLIEQLNNLDFNRVVMAGERTTKWGIDFDEIHTKFGSLYVLHSEIFDQCGHAADGMVIDPEYIQKYCHIPFQAERLDLKRSGVRNTDAVVLTEASCLVLRYPGAHMRIVPVGSPLAPEPANNKASSK